MTSDYRAGQTMSGFGDTVREHATAVPDLAGAVWRKSSFSGSNGCVEVAFLDRDHIATRDTKDRRGPALIFSASAWSTFLDGVAVGDFTRR